jgi:hypothetical protein
MARPRAGRRRAVARAMTGTHVRTRESELFAAETTYRKDTMQLHHAVSTMYGAVAGMRRANAPLLVTSAANLSGEVLTRSPIA